MGRQAGWVVFGQCEIPLWDLDGHRHYGVPYTKSQGDGFRDKVRVECDTDATSPVHRDRQAGFKGCGWIRFHLP